MNSIKTQLVEYLLSYLHITIRVFGSVVVIAFQIAFRAEKHVNNVFLFLKNHF